MRNTGRVATVVMARCKRSKMPFGIRVEKKQDIWYCTWTFKLEERTAKNEGYDTVSISGQMALEEEYPGCPHCGSMGWFKCGACGRITCQGDETIVTCSWCGNQGETVMSDRFDLTGSGY